MFVLCVDNKKFQPKCTFVTIQDYKKQHQQPKRTLQKSLVLKDVDKGNVRRKLALLDYVNNGEKSGKVVQVTK